MYTKHYASTPMPFIQPLMECQTTTVMAAGRTQYNKTFVQSRLRARCATHDKYFRSLSFSKIWLESRLLCMPCSIAAQEYTWHAQGHYVKIWRHPQNRMYITYRNAKATGNMRKTSAEFGRVFSSYASGQTERQTDMLIAILCAPLVGRSDNGNSSV